jgi:hypothetical protein
VQKWEYFKLDVQYHLGNIHSPKIEAVHINGASAFITDIKSLRAYLNTLGKDGWDIISVIATGKGEGYTLKRPIE